MSHLRSCVFSFWSFLTCCTILTQDQIPPYPTSTALEFLEVELGAPASQLYAYITPEPVAAASLGQVYKGTSD